MTGQPAASADAVSPPQTENANGKLLAPKTTTGPRAIEHPAKIRLGRRSRCVGSVDRRINPRAFAHQVGEHLQLIARSRPLARQPGARQRRLLLCAFQQCIAKIHDLRGDRIQKRRLPCMWQIARLRKRFGRGAKGRVDLLVAGLADRRRKVLSRRGIFRLKRRAAAARPLAVDQMRSSKLMPFSVAWVFSPCFPSNRSHGLKTRATERYSRKEIPGIQRSSTARHAFADDTTSADSR